MAKVASGGELSRLMLAIKYITAQLSKVNILVFDEIDTGVSGEIASLMGDMMLKISKKNQLIAISHLPQIASKANSHLKVVKRVFDSNTFSDVIALNKHQRVEEIAKLFNAGKIHAPVHLYHGNENQLINISPILSETFLRFKKPPVSVLNFNLLVEPALPDLIYKVARFVISSLPPI